MSTKKFLLLILSLVLFAAFLTNGCVTTSGNTIRFSPGAAIRQAAAERKAADTQAQREQQEEARQAREAAYRAEQQEQAAREAAKSDTSSGEQYRVNSAPDDEPSQKPVVSESKKRFDDFMQTALDMLGCIHNTGQLEKAKILQEPWSEQRNNDATSSAFIRLTWGGMTRQLFGVLGTYETDVALLINKSTGKRKIIVLRDTAIQPHNNMCRYLEWY